MKKLILTVITALICSNLFARGDIEVSYLFEPGYQTTGPVLGLTNSKIDAPSFVGFTAGGNVYFGQPAAKFIDIGLGINLGCNFAFNAKIYNTGMSELDGTVFPSDSSMWTGFFVNIGPAFNFNFIPKAALYVRPAFCMAFRGADITNGHESEKFISSTFTFDIEVAGRFWFGKNVGLNIGTDFCMGGGEFILKYKENSNSITKPYKLNTAFSWKAKIGCIWRLGY